MATRAAGRAQVFARGALDKGLVSRSQAEECLAVARKLKKRGKGQAIEEIFVRKGYLNRTEAASIARRLKKKGVQPELDLVDEPAADCPNCHRDPGSGADCFRCGADLVTGGPGPRATACGSCGQVVLRGTALCPGCARPVDDVRRQRSSNTGGKRAADRLILVGTLAGMGYFIHHHATAQAPEPEVAPQDAEAPEAHPAFAEASAALKKGDADAALASLEAALATEGLPPHTRGKLLRAVAAVAPAPRATSAAREALEAGEDPALRLRLAQLALASDTLTAAENELQRIPVASRDDEAWRLIAELDRRKDRDWIDAVLRIESPTPEESHAVALALLARGGNHQKNRRKTEALRDLRRACIVDPALAEAQFALGLYLLELGEDEKALRALRQAVRVDPTPAAPYLALGMALERQKKTQAAVASYAEFIRQAKSQGGHEARIAHARSRLEALSQ